MGVVYKVSNNFSDKVYIGITRNSIEYRWSQHLYDCEYVDNKFYKAMREYGKQNFKCEIIEEIDNSILEEREKYWINYYDSYKNGYNSTLGGDGHVRYSDEELISLWEQGLNVSQICNELKCERHTIYKRLSSIIPNFTEENFQRVYAARREPRLKQIEELWNQGKTNQEIAKILNIDRHVPKRYLQRLESFSEEEWEKRNIEQIKKSNPQKKAVKQYSKEGVYIQTFESLSEAARQIGNVNKASNILAAIKGKQKSAYGYLWKYAED